jgi:hypothetical protein
MSDEPGPDAGAVIAGILLLLAGLCLTLLGGGCTLLTLSWIGAPGASGSGENMTFVLIGLVILAGGLGLVWTGFRLMTRGFNKRR